MRDLILCLDLASIVGWAVFDVDGYLLASGVWELDEDDRWTAFRVELERLLVRYRGRLCGIAFERPVMLGKPGRDWRSGRVLFGQAALVELAAARWSLPTVMITPSEIKGAATGNGSAGKPAVIAAMEERYGPLSIQPGGKTKADRARREKARSDEADARGCGLVVTTKFCPDALRERRFVEVAHG